MSLSTSLEEGDGVYPGQYGYRFALYRMGIVCNPFHMVVTKPKEGCLQSTKGSNWYTTLSNLGCFLAAVKPPSQSGFKMQVR